MTLRIVTWRDPEGKLGSRGATWIAETSVDEQTFSTKSKNGAPNPLARILIKVGIPDQPAGFVSLRYRSLANMAKWTYTESNRVLQRVRWEPRPGGLSGSYQNPPDSEFA